MKQVHVLMAILGLAGSAYAQGGAGDLGGMLNELTSGMTATSTVRLAEASALQRLLPMTVGSLRRVEATSGTEKALAASVSKARGRYEGPGGARLTIEISDWGSRARIAWGRMGLAAERAGTSAQGYDRDVDIQGWPAVERLDRSRQTGQIHIRVKERFIVSATGERMDEAQLIPARTAVDTRRLAALDQP